MLNAHAPAVGQFRELVPFGKISTNFAFNWGEAADPTSPADQAGSFVKALCYVLSKEGEIGGLLLVLWLAKG